MTMDLITLRLCFSIQRATKSIFQMRASRLHLFRTDFNTTRDEIIEFLGLKKERCIVPEYNMELILALGRNLLSNSLDIVPNMELILELGRILLSLCLDILLVYIHCLSQSRNPKDAKELTLVIQKLDPWLKDLDGDDMKKRSLLVEILIETISYHDDDLAAERIAVILVEHNKVCKDDHMLEMGMAFVRKDIWGKNDFLRRVIGHLDRH